MPPPLQRPRQRFPRSLAASASGQTKELDPLVWYQQWLLECGMGGDGGGNQNNGADDARLSAVTAAVLPMLRDLQQRGYFLAELPSVGSGGEAPMMDLDVRRGGSDGL